MPELVLLGVWIASILAAGFVGGQRGRDSAGFMLGLFLGPVGLIAAGLLPPTPEWEARHRLSVDDWLLNYRADAEHERAETERKRADDERRSREAAEESRIAAASAQAPRKALCPVCGARNVFQPNEAAHPCVQCGELLSAKLGG